MGGRQIGLMPPNFMEAELHERKDFMRDIVN